MKKQNKEKTTESTETTGKYRCMKCEGEDIDVHGLYCKNKEKGDAK